MATILIVDDEPVLRDMMEMALRDPGRVIVQADSCAEATRVIDSLGGIDIAILDKNLPDGDGLQLFGRLRTRHPHAEGIIFTGYASMDSAVYALRLGAFDYFTKPLEDLTKLEIAVKNALNKVSLSAERDQLYKQIAHDTLHDRLTGLPNQALFIDHVTKALALAQRRSNTRWAVLSIQVDRFMQVTESLGLDASDQLLWAVAERMKTVFRRSDTVARFFGPQFGALLEDVDIPSDPVRAAQRLQATLADPFVISGHEVYATASVGITFSSIRYKHADEVLRDANVAMYRAQAAGGGRHVLFDEQMHKHAAERMLIENALRHVHERDELRLHYQPIMGLRDKRLRGFEALVRWERPGHGMVYPADFIPVAEQTGSIVSIGSWVLRAACQQLATWQENSSNGLKMNVNVSSRQLMQDTFVDEVAAVIDDCKIEAETLHLEITESALIENLSVSRRQLAALKELGVHIALDDFGTGYSSLSYLHQLPLDHLKIDRQFIEDVTADPKKATLLGAVINLSRNLGYIVTAEGVETQEQLEHLDGLGCELVQGYYFSKPVPADAAASFLA